MILALAFQASAADSPTFSIILFAAALFLIFTARYNQRKKRLQITDYKRGIRFRNGEFVAVLGPGSYTYDSRKEQITVVDMRPEPILFEHLAIRDVAGSEGVISFSADLMVADPQLSSASLREEIKDAYRIAHEALMTSVSRQVLSGSDRNNEGILAKLTADINFALAKVGMKIAGAEITELWVAVAPMTIVKGSETVQ